MAQDRKSKQPAAADVRSLTDVEWVIMDAVWGNEPCAAGTVQEALEAEHGWAYSTIKTTMDRMVAKGILATKSIRNLQLFSSAITRDDARRVEVRKLLQRAFDGALTPMIQFLVEKEELSTAEVQELREMLNSAKRRKQ
jgi:BlaI family transcriptional regulator, penicillinase repressor